MAKSDTFLSQDVRLPVLIIIFGLIFLFTPLSPWPTIVISTFGLFLLIQSFTLKIQITEKDFVVWQMGKELRRFPFKYWLSWKIILPSLPGFFYFREEASPHLLPIIFNKDELRQKLEKIVGNIEIK